MIRFKRWYDMKAMTPEERRLYFVWKSMKERCSNPNNIAWKEYGGRGISVHPTWIDDFATFAKDVGIPPTPGLELDRHPNNDGNYEPGNTRWVTHAVNMTNVRSNRPITINGVTKLMCQWADEYGIDRTTFHCRLKMGWSGQRLLTSPRKEIFVTIEGVTKSATEWSRSIPMAHTGFLHRLEQGETGAMLLRPSQKQKKP